jgi:hypothetical protein
VVVHEPGQPEVRQDVERVRGDAVPHALSRGKPARSSSSTRAPGRTRSADSAAADPAGPAPTTTRSHTALGTEPVWGGRRLSAR